jgi:hypothetical protein
LPLIFNFKFDKVLGEFREETVQTSALPQYFDVSSRQRHIFHFVSTSVQILLLVLHLSVHLFLDTSMESCTPTDGEDSLQTQRVDKLDVRACFGPIGYLAEDQTQNGDFEMV